MRFPGGSRSQSCWQSVFSLIGPSCMADASGACVPSSTSTLRESLPKAAAPRRVLALLTAAFDLRRVEQIELRAVDAHQRQAGKKAVRVDLLLCHRPQGMAHDGGKRLELHVLTALA